MIENTFLGKISKSLEDSQNFEIWSNWMEHYDFPNPSHVSASLIWDIQGNMKQFNSIKMIYKTYTHHTLEYTAE